MTVEVSSATVLVRVSCISAFQQAIAKEKLDGWLFYDFQGLDPIARRLLKISKEAHLTRRWFYYVPRKGKAQKLVHRIEPHALAHLEGDTHLYCGWKELERVLQDLLGSQKKVAMNYSFRNAIPYVSRVDGGTIELVKACGVKICTSANLISQFESVWNEEQLQTHIRAAKALRSIVDNTFEHVARKVTNHEKLSEYDVQQFILDCFQSMGLVSNSPPIVGVGPNSGDVHYSPTKDHARWIEEEDFLLMDLWAKEPTLHGVYADITWTGFVGKSVPRRYEDIFHIVRGARDEALRFVEDTLGAQEPLQGAQVDDVARGYIERHGYGECFLHRTGHSIGAEVHGNGANLDNYETKEERKILPWTCFSIEPGIYLKEFGIRSEINVFVAERDVTVFGQPIQTQVVPILKV